MLRMESPPTKEATSIDTVANNQTLSTQPTSPHSTTSKPSPKRTLSDMEPVTCPSFLSLFPLVTQTTGTDSDSTALTTPAITSSPTAHSSPKTEPNQQKSPNPPNAIFTNTLGTIPKPKIILLHHDTIIDGRHIITRTIQNCFAAILGPAVLPPSEATILNAFAHNATLAEALVQLGAFKTPGTSFSSSPGSTSQASSSSSAAAAAVANSDNTKSTPKGKGKGKAKATDPSIPTQEEKQYDYQHAIAHWTQAYLHYTHEFLSEFDIYSDLEPFVKQMKQQGVIVVILIAHDGFDKYSPEQTQTSNGRVGDKDDKKKKKKPQPAHPANGVKIIRELMRRMGVTAAGKGARGYQDVGRQASGGSVVVVNGIYASGIDGDRFAKVWKGEVLPGWMEGKNAGEETNATKDTTTTDSTAMQKDEVIFACCSKQYLSLARAIGATACWVARCEDKGKMTERQADLVVGDLEKLGQLIGGDMESNGKEEEVLGAGHSSKKGGNGTSEMKGQTPKNGKATPEAEDIEMPDVDHNVEAAVDRVVKGGQDGESEKKSERKLVSPKAMKAIKTEVSEDDTVATVVQKKSPTGKKRAREDDLDEWLPVEIAVEKGAEDVPFVDLTEES
ncbi:hypothetical protein QBC32DRAFT_376400 [Pseudoneurospora amorphoporcata]|uniref:Uncharacterized protein n=1 Tax=Pseudoneurospora amorphoporcata TaxID=241081 RepID=A0AAN6P1C5_9PEZI|nr:hypothetical protein QBC32DRAFT_376400 [Pseudoneurospora amorphoporcata]